MEKKYESLTLFEFQEKFPDNDSCQEYLSELKWPKGFKCERCGHDRYCGGKLQHTRQCTKCNRLLPLVAPYSTRLNSHF